MVDPTDACLFGASLGSVDSISAVLGDSLKVMEERLVYLSAHAALILLWNSFAIPKLLYTPRTAPCFLCPTLKSYDELLTSIVSSITNIDFRAEDSAWSQATLLIRLGGLGIRCSVRLAPSAFLASAAATCDLVQRTLPTHLKSLTHYTKA